MRGHIQYFATSYSKSLDHEGRAAIRYNGKEIIKGNYWNQYVKAHLFPKDDTYDRRMRESFPFIDNTALELGVFDQRCFYHAFDKFDNQNIDKSLSSDNLIVRIFAVLDRRVGKRRLISMRNFMEEQPPVFQEFYAIRMHHEGL
ncbi:SF0329 family protein [Veillonella sp.]